MAVSEPEVTPSPGTTAAHAVRRQSATYIGNLDNDTPRTPDCTRAQIRSRTRDSSAPENGCAGEAKKAVPLRDGKVIVALDVGGVEEAKPSVKLCAEVDNGVDERVGRDFSAGTEVFYDMMAGDRISTARWTQVYREKAEECRAGVPVVQARQLLSQEDTQADVIRREFEGLIDNDTLESSALPVERRLISLKQVQSWKANHLGKVTVGRARLVIRGFMQGEGLDCLDMFSETPIPPSIQMITTTALQSDWTLSY